MLNTIDLLKWINQETKAGRFKDHQAARTVMKHYIEYLWITEDSGKNKKMHVMSGMIWPAVVAEYTGLSLRTVERANDWLEGERLISIERIPHAGKPAVGSVRVLVENSQGIDISRRVGLNNDMVSGYNDMVSGYKPVARHGVVDKESSLKRTNSAARRAAVKTPKDLDKEIAELTGLALTNVPVPDDGREDSPVANNDMVSLLPKSRSKRETHKTQAMKDAQWAEDIVARERGSK